MSEDKVISFKISEIYKKKINELYKELNENRKKYGLSEHKKVTKKRFWEWVINNVNFKISLDKENKIKKEVLKKEIKGQTKLIERNQ